jgi:cystathionine beta-lyase family protein involved in aluminum resistance
MKTYPLKSISLEQAKQKQFKLIDEICKEFKGSEYLNAGDYGLVPGMNKPVYAQKVENVLANYFSCEKALLVTGSGTGAIRWALSAIFNKDDKILIHTAPIYPTSEVSINSLGLNIIRADFNSLKDIENTIAENPDIKGALVQYTRQAIEDSYDIQEVINTIKKCNNNIKIITDDNYAVMKVEKIGVEMGSDVSTCSCFKLQGPEGVGLLLGQKEILDKVEKMNYSGGSKVQGPQAMEVLRGLIYSPVMLAIQAEVNEELVERLNSGSIPEIKDAFLANAQSKVLLVEFNEPIAKAVLKNTEKLGGLPNPVGAESKYESVPMFYKVSGTFLKANPSLIDTMIRINPNRAGADTIIRILSESIKEAKNVSK